MVDYHVFDYVDKNTNMLDRMPADSTVSRSFIRCVETVDCYSLEDVNRQLDRFMAEGYEGIIIRHPYQVYIPDSRIWMMKLKPTKQLEATIIDVKEERTQDGDRKGTLGAIQCEIYLDYYYSDPPARVTFWVGSGFTAEERSSMWDTRDKLFGRIAVVKFQDYSSQGVPYFTRIVRIK
jgi:ATP-dependent DNA ligase